MRDYFTLIILGFLAGCLYVLRVYDELKAKSWLTTLRRVIAGVGSSMLVTYVAYEILLFQGLPQGVSVAISAGIGYIGAESVSSLITLFFERQLKK